MNLIYFSVLYFFTFFLFLILCYLFYLRFFVLIRQIDFTSKIAINLTTYLIVLYFVPFFCSLLINVFFYSATLAGELIGWYASNVVDSQELQPTHQIVHSPTTDEWVVFGKKTGKPIASKVNSTEKVNALTQMATGKTPDSVKSKSPD